jgi:hypothetical protein
VAALVWIDPNDHHGRGCPSLPIRRQRHPDRVGWSDTPQSRDGV